MASLIETLFSILEEEATCYKALLKMADNKKEVIIKGNVPSLQEITKYEQELAGHILRLEKKREESIKDICHVTNHLEEDMTIRKLINILEDTEKRTLEKISDELVEVLEELKKVNETNKLLLEQSLEYIDYTVNVTQSLSSGPQGNTYHSKGGRYNEPGGRNFFDAKQ